MNKLFLSLVIAITLSGCNGGGGTSTPPLQSAPASKAATNFFTHQQSVTLHASVNGHSLKLELSYIPGGPATFNGIPGQSGQQTVAAYLDGTVFATGISTIYFNASDPDAFQILGNEDSTGTPYEVYGSPGVIPSQVNIGESGPVGTSTVFHDSSMAVQDAQDITTYSVRPNNSSTLLFCVNDQTENVTAQGQSDGVEEGTETDCYSVGTDGSVSLVSATLYFPGEGTITFN